MARIRPVMDAERRSVCNKNIYISTVPKLVVNKARNKRKQLPLHLPLGILSYIAIVPDTS